MDTFASWLTTFLDRNGMSGNRFAERVGVTAPNVYRWLAGSRVPSPESCRAISDEFQVDLDVLLSLAGHREPPAKAAFNHEAEQLATTLRQIDLRRNARGDTLEVLLRRWAEEDESRRQALPASTGGAR